MNNFKRHEEIELLLAKHTARELAGMVVDLKEFERGVIEIRGTRQKWAAELAHIKQHKNKIKADAVREFASQFDYNLDYPCYCVRRIAENYANKLENQND